MTRCIIFCAGEFDGFLLPAREGDYIIAADGGLAHVSGLGLIPNEVLGDFDSLGYAPEGAAVFPVEKDDTDAMLAIRRGLSLGYKEFILYGSLDGPRLDHTLANLQALSFLAQNGAVGYLVGNRNIATAVRNETVCFPETAEGILSLFCLGGDARVSIKGLKYELEDGTLTSGFPLGVSNHFVGKEAKITASIGDVLMIYDRENGLPAGEKRQC